MGNDNPQELLTDVEAEMISEEPPSCENSLGVLDEVFDGISAVELLANAEINLSAFLLCVESPMERQQKLDKSTFMFEAPLDALFEAELDVLSDEEVLCYLQAEGIDCELFIARTMNASKDSLIA